MPTNVKGTFVYYVHLCVVITIMNQLCQLLAPLKWSVRVSVNYLYLSLLAKPE